MKRLDGVVLIAGRTARSQAYVQAMANAGLAPEHVVLFGDYAPRAAAPAPDGPACEVFLPDLAQPIEQTCLAIGSHMHSLPVGDVNAPELADCLDRLAPKLAIYSGYGGQIVGPHLIAKPFPMLHAHPGWLPDFRGSTTVYYTWLDHGGCSVTVFILAAGIDTGAILARKHYAAPPARVNVDYVYDNAIRADLMVEVLSDHRRTGRLEPIAEQDPESHANFYVIHPVLKHLALLRQDGAGC